MCFLPEVERGFLRRDKLKLKPLAFLSDWTHKAQAAVCVCTELAVTVVCKYLTLLINPNSLSRWRLPALLVRVSRQPSVYNAGKVDFDVYSEDEKSSSAGNVLFNICCRVRGGAFTVYLPVGLQISRCNTLALSHPVLTPPQQSKKTNGGTLFLSRVCLTPAAVFLYTDTKSNFTEGLATAVNTALGAGIWLPNHTDNRRDG